MGKIKNKEYIKELIKKIQADGDLTQADISQRVGASLVSVNHWATGKYYPHLIFQRRLEDMLGFVEKQAAFIKQFDELQQDHKA